jgi:hypothetical protein
LIPVGCRNGSTHICCSICQFVTGLSPVGFDFKEDSSPSVGYLVMKKLEDLTKDVIVFVVVQAE